MISLSGRCDPSKSDFGGICSRVVDARRPAQKQQRGYCSMNLCVAERLRAESFMAYPKPYQIAPRLDTLARGTIVPVVLGNRREFLNRRLGRRSDGRPNFFPRAGQLTMTACYIAWIIQSFRISSNIATSCASTTSSSKMSLIVLMCDPLKC